MKFEVITFMLNPFVLMFITIALGLLFGKVKFGKFNFGTSGAMFVGLAIGWLVYGYAQGIYEAGDETAAGYAAAVQIMEGNGGRVIHSYFFQASLIVFIAAVGLLAAKDIGYVLRKYGTKFVVLGLLITFVGAASTYACTAVVKDTNSFAVAGVYTGALTSSPGLASALESAESHSKEMANNYESASPAEKKAVIRILNLDEKYKDLTVENTPKLEKRVKEAYVNQSTSQVGVGYAVGYPFGVIIVILAVNFLNVIFRFDIEEEKRRYQIEMSAVRESTKSAKEIETTKFSIIAFAVVCFVGYLIGSIKIYMGPLGYVSLESTGGVLIGGLLLGYIGKIGPMNFRMDPETLSVIRELALAFFLAIVGLNYGYGAVDALFGSGLTLALVSIVVGVISCMVGFLVGRYAFHLNWIMLSGAICGGMTSTPGLGAATDAVGSEDPAGGYGATYPFALFGMVVFTIILYKLPML